MKVKKAKSRLTGFLDGYKANNVALFRSSLAHHQDEINEKIHSIIKDSVDERKEVFRLLNKAEKVLEERKLDDLPKLVKFGEALKTAIVAAKGVDEDLKTLHDPRFRMIVYHFLEVAEKANNKKVNDLAIEIGESL